MITNTKYVVLIRSNEIYIDSRVLKYITFFESKKINYLIIGWNRSGKLINFTKTLFFTYKSKYGNKSIFLKFLWFFFVIKELIKIRNNIRMIHACDLDSAIPAFLFTKLRKRKMVFDVFDWVNGRKNIIYRYITIIESFIANHADFLILCDENRLKLKKVINQNLYILKNIPFIKYKENEFYKLYFQKIKRRFKHIITYAGVFDENRGLEDLIKVALSQKEIYFNIVGFGKLEFYIKERIKNISNIRFWGKKEYDICLNIMANSDVLVAFYYLTNPIHKFASPNKYYEGLMLGKPIITNYGTSFSKKVKKFDTGYVIDEGESFLYELVSSEEFEKKMKIKKENAKRLWNIYSSYLDVFFKEVYTKIILNNN